MNGDGIFPGLVVRAAATDDIPALTELHLASFGPEEHVPVLLGKDYVRATYRWLLHDRGCYCQVAELYGKVVGVVGVCDGPYTRLMFIACLPELTKSLLRSPRLLAEKRLWGRMSRRAASSDSGRLLASQPDIAQITIVAIDAGYRGLGIFPALIADTQTLSKDRGSRAIQSGVYKFNQSSRRAFIKAGWIETPELETEDTVFFLHYVDPGLPRALSISLPVYEGGIESER